MGFVVDINGRVGKGKKAGALVGRCGDRKSLLRVQIEATFPAESRVNNFMNGGFSSQM